jgi:tRNA threonylcarbamoyladenosine biosynthesis protein TsaB
MRHCRLLAFDTTTPQGSVALLQGERTLVERRWTAEDSHSCHVLSEIDACLQLSQVNLKEISYLVSVIGPGSFTGIRIGLGVAQGLASAHDIPILGVTAFEVLAFSVGYMDRQLHAVIDAHRNQVYAQSFRKTTSNPEAIGNPTCDFLERWIESLEIIPACFIGSGAKRFQSQIEQWNSACEILEDPIWLAVPAAQLALLRLQRGLMESRSRIEALYVRPPDVFIPRNQPKSGQFQP